MLKDLSLVKNWTLFKPSLCDTCWATCCHDMAVEVSVPDLVRLGLLSEDEATGSLPQAATRLRHRGLIREFRKGALVFTLEQQESGDCIFLDENRRCTVYEKRPEICRQFPKIGPKPGHCPYRRVER